MAKVKSHLCCRVFPDNQPSLVIPSSELLLQLLHLTYDPLDYSWSSKGHIYFYGPSVIFLKVRITLYMSLYTRPSAYITWLSQQPHHFSVMLISHLFPPSAYLLFFFLFSFCRMHVSQPTNLNVQEIYFPLLLLHLDLISTSSSSFANMGTDSVSSVFFFLPLPGG